MHPIGTSRGMKMPDQKGWEHDFEITSDPKGPQRGTTFWLGFEACFRSATPTQIAQVTIKHLCPMPAICFLSEFSTHWQTSNSNLRVVRMDPMSSLLGVVKCLEAKSVRWEHLHTDSVGLLSSLLVQPSSLQPSAVLNCEKDCVSEKWQSDVNVMIKMIKYFNF